MLTRLKHRSLEEACWDWNIINERYPNGSIPRWADIQCLNKCIYHAKRDRKWDFSCSWHKTSYDTWERKSDLVMRPSLAGEIVTLAFDSGHSCTLLNVSWEQNRLFSPLLSNIDYFLGWLLAFTGKILIATNLLYGSFYGNDRPKYSRCLFILFDNASYNVLSN